MRKEVITVLVVILALALAGCQSNGKTPGSDSSTPFIGGSTGLTAKFATNSPPAEVTDLQKDTAGKPTNTFDVIVLLENAGESKVPKSAAVVSISGISATDFYPSKSLKGTNNDELSEVKKDTEGNKIPGSVADVRFENLAFQTALQGNAVFPVQADVCYTYQTKVVTDLCIRSDATKSTSGVCQITGQKTVFNSGAPVQVSSVKENVGGRNKVLLTFGVKTVGTGSIFKPDLVGGQASCPRGTFSAENQALIEVNTGMAGVTCSGLSGGSATATGYKGYLRLDNGAGTFSCIQPTPAEDSIKKINVLVTYNHLITASTSLLVKHLPTDTGTVSTPPSPTGGSTGTPAAPPAPTPPGGGTSGGLQLSTAGIAWVSSSDATGVAALQTLCSKVVGGQYQASLDYPNPPKIDRCYCPNNNKIPSLTITSFTC